MRLFISAGEPSGDLHGANLIHALRQRVSDLARRARAHGIPVLYFVPPQLWGWGSWRVRKMRRLTDRVLCTLPFEEEWYRQRHVAAEYIGHPYFDELRGQRLDEAFLAAQRARPGTIIGLLPGSRNQELHYNLASLLRAAARIHACRPDVRFLVACFRERHRRQVEARLADWGLPIEAHTGRTPEIIHLAYSCLAVSGSVSLELLYQGKPSAILYRHHWTGIALAHLLKNCRYITLVNLLANKELFPEYFGTKCPAEMLAEHVLHWLNDRSAYEALCSELAALRERVAVPGACERAAEAVLAMVRNRARHLRTA